MISQHWFRQWLGAIRQQPITWANVDPDLWYHMVSLGHNELKLIYLTLNGQSKSGWDQSTMTATMVVSIWNTYFIPQGQIKNMAKTKEIIEITIFQLTYSRQIASIGTSLVQLMVACSAQSHYRLQCWHIVDWTIGTTEICTKIQSFSRKKIHSKTVVLKWQPYFLSLSMLKHTYHGHHPIHTIKSLI